MEIRVIGWGKELVEYKRRALQNHWYELGGFAIDAFNNELPIFYLAHCPAGWAMLTDDKSGFALMVWVQPEFRRQGWGTRLVQTLLNYAPPDLAFRFSREDAPEFFDYAIRLEGGNDSRAERPSLEGLCGLPLRHSITLP